MPADRPARRQDCLEFEVEIGVGRGRSFPVTVRSPAGEAKGQMRFPFDELALENRLQALEIALLQASGTRRSIRSSQEETVQDFGKALFDTLVSGEIRNCYDVSRSQAQQKELPLRLKLRIDSPQLAALPWEFLCDPRDQSYLSLSLKTPIVRYPSLARAVEPLPVTAPLRILAMIANPTDLPELDTERERQRVEAAVKNLPNVELVWLTGQTWRDLLQAMRQGPWHIFHFIGHGGFDESTDEGVLMLAREDGRGHTLHASDLRHLIADHFSLRFVFLNACEGARGGKRDVFSSTAANLVQNGVPAVLAMQYEISDRAAVEFSRTFYEALADGTPVDEAVTEARKAIRLESPNSLEWGTPVLYMHTMDTLLFKLASPVESVVRSEAAAVEGERAIVEERRLRLVAEQRTQALEAQYQQALRDSSRGRWTDALRSFEEIQRWDPGFRELPQRLQQVREALARAPRRSAVEVQPAPRTSAPDSRPPLSTSGATIVYQPRPLRPLVGHTRAVSSLAISPNSQILASGSLDQTVRLWRLVDGAQVAVLSSHVKQVNHVAFAPDGRTLASASGGAWGADDCVVRLWRVADGSLLHVLKGHTGQVLNTSYSPNGQLLATAAADTTVRLWRTADGVQQLQLRGHTKQVRSVVFSPDGQILASKANDTTIRVWRVADGLQLGSVKGQISLANVAMSSDGRYIASGSLDGAVRVWQASDSALIFASPSVKQVNHVAFSPDDRMLACAAEDGTVRLWPNWSEADDGSARRLTGHTKSVSIVAFSPDGQLLASGSVDHSVRIWRTSDGAQLAALALHVHPVAGLAFSADGRFLASAAEDSTVRLWSLTDG